MNEYQIAMREEYNKQKAIDIYEFILSILVVFAVPTISVLFFGIVGVLIAFIWIGFVMSMVFCGGY